MKGVVIRIYVFLSTIKSNIFQYLSEAIKKKKGNLISTNDVSKQKACKNNAIAQYGTFNDEELISVLCKAGLHNGCILFVHCSFNDLYTFSGSPLNVLSALRKIVGTSGTLLMPTYTTNTFVKPPRLFDVTKEPTYTGLVNELFRRSPGIIRSLHPRHSICGEGPHANDLLLGHERCIHADGFDSPFDRLRQYDNAYILTLGLPPGFLSILHWIEDIDPTLLPFPIHERKPVSCQVRDKDGRIHLVQDWRIMSHFSRRNDFLKISQMLSPSSMRYWTHKGVAIGVYHANSLTEELIKLRDRHIIHYHWQ